MSWGKGTSQKIIFALIFVISTAVLTWNFLDKRYSYQARGLIQIGKYLRYSPEEVDKKKFAYLLIEEEGDLLQRLREISRMQFSSSLAVERFDTSVRGLVSLRVRANEEQLAEEILQKVIDQVLIEHGTRFRSVEHGQQAILTSLKEQDLEEYLRLQSVLASPERVQTQLSMRKTERLESNLLEQLLRVFFGVVFSLILAQSAVEAIGMLGLSKVSV